MNHRQVQKRHRRRGEGEAEKSKTGKVTSWTNKISEISIFSQMTFNRFFSFCLSFIQWMATMRGLFNHRHQLQKLSMGFHFFSSCFFAWINVWTTANTNDQSTHNWMQRIFHLIKCYSLQQDKRRSETRHRFIGKLEWNTNAISTLRNKY